MLGLAGLNGSHQHQILFLGETSLEKTGILYILHTVCCRAYRTKWLAPTPEPVFVNLLRSRGIDSQPGVPVRQVDNLVCRTGPPGYIG
jgi:hypothetical protein